MNDCENCRHINFLGLPDWSTMPCAVCARYGADNDPTMWEAKPQTNYDRIISKTPEELARLLASIANCNECKIYSYKDGCMENHETCVCQWLDWLKQEATG